MSWREVGFKRMLTDWARDPVRRWHVGTRIVETMVPSFLTLVWHARQIGREPRKWQVG